MIENITIFTEQQQVQYCNSINLGIVNLENLILWIVYIHVTVLVIAMIYLLYKVYKRRFK